MTGTRRKTSDAPEDTVEVPDEDLLSSSPFDGDLSRELAAAPAKRRGRPSVTVFLAAGVLLVAGFAGGIQADKHWGSKKSPDAGDIIGQLARARGTQGGGGQFGAGQFGSGQFGSGRQSGGGTTGTVKLVDGDVLYVQTAGGIVRVKTSGSTKVTSARKVKLKDLKAGSSVVVQGAAGQDGTVTATSVAQGK